MRNNNGPKNPEGLRIGWYIIDIVELEPSIKTMYDNYNVTTCNNLPHGGIFFTRNTCASKTLSHKAVLIPTIYTTGTHHFSIVSIGYFWRKVNFRKCKKFTRRGKNHCFLAIIFSTCRLSSPNFACRVCLKYFLYDITHNSGCLPYFEKTQL